MVEQSRGPTTPKPLVQNQGKLTLLHRDPQTSEECPYPYRKDSSCSTGTEPLYKVT